MEAVSFTLSETECLLCYWTTIEYLMLTFKYQWNNLILWGFERQFQIFRNSTQMHRAFKKIYIFKLFTFWSIFFTEMSKNIWMTQTKQ